MRLLRVPADTAIADLAPRLRCKSCGARDGFTLAIAHTHGRGNQLARPLDRVIVKT